MVDWQDEERRRLHKLYVEDEKRFYEFYDKYLEHLKHPDKIQNGAGIFLQMIKDKSKNENI